MHVGQEPHVEHPIGFIDDHDFDRAEVDVLETHVVQQSPRRGDDDFAAVAQRPLLRTRVDPTDDGHRTEADVVAERKHLLVDLQGQLARRRQNESAAADLSSPLQALQDGQEEGRCLAGARRCAADQVTTGQDDRYALRLDRRRASVSHVRHRLGQGRNQVELVHWWYHRVSRGCDDAGRGRDGGETDWRPWAARCERDAPRKCKGANSETS